MSRQVAASHFQKSKTLNDKYLLGEELGKGAHGRVYKGVDLQNGDFVAIKQVSLENISPGDLSNIMSEIDLLKNLNHKNIVKYLGSYKTKSHLYIFLEFVENGSLASIIKPTKFGAFPESLVAIYITQVLEGLVYLHEQGVIHRDIKGANILTTKEGLVKLADFGVATKLTEADENAPDVVGTPYWMAPEVILMSGVSAASDIWSVGCTVIELLTCVPPYFNLQPMSALFRIVQNGTPPLPDDLSTDLTDFLLQCFHKDAKQRPDAASLLRHPWIRNSRRAIRSSLVRSSGRISYVPEDVSTVVERTIGDAELNGSPEIIRPSVEKAVTPELTRSSTHDGSMERSASANEVRALETSGDKGATLSQTQTPRFMQPVVNGAVIPSHRRANSDDAAPRPPRSQTNSFTSQQHSERGAVVGARSSPDLSRNSTLEGGSNGISWTSNGSKYRATSSAERPVPNGGKLEAVVVDKRMGDYGGAVSSRQGIEEFPGETGPTPRKKNQVFVEKQVKGTRSMNVPGRKSSRKHSMDYADAVLADIVDAAPVEEPPGNREVPPRPLGSFGSNGRATRGRLERAVSLDGGASSQVLDAAIAESQAMMVG